MKNMIAFRQLPDRLSIDNVLQANGASYYFPTPLLFLLVLVCLKPQDFSWPHPLHEELVPNGIQVIPATVFIVESQSLIVLLVLDLPQVLEEDFGDESQVDHEEDIAPELDHAGVDEVFLHLFTDRLPCISLGNPDGAHASPDAEGREEDGEVDVLGDGNEQVVSLIVGNPQVNESDRHHSHKRPDKPNVDGARALLIPRPLRQDFEARVA